MSTSTIAPLADASSHDSRKTGFWALTLGSIGVVYGDIGTSPLYAIKESLTAARGTGTLSSGMIFGVFVADALGTHHHRDPEVRAHYATCR